MSSETGSQSVNLDENQKPDTANRSVVYVGEGRPRAPVPVIDHRRFVGVIPAKILPTPITKEKMRFGRRGNIELIYPHPAMHVGQYMHFTIEDQLSGEMKPRMPRYIEHLNGLSPRARVGERLVQVADTTAQKVGGEIRAYFPPNTNTTVFTEVDTGIPPRQVQVIEEAVRDTKLKAYVTKKLGYFDLSTLARDAVTNPQFSIPNMWLRSADAPIFSRPIANAERLRLEDIFEISRAIQEMEPSLTAADPRYRVIDFVASVMGYLYFDMEALAGVDKLDVREIPEWYRRLLHTGSARSDFIALSVPVNDLESQELVQKLETFYNQGFLGTRFLMDFAGQSPHDRRLILEVIQRIYQGRIHLTMGEIKGEFSAYRQSAAKRKAKVVFQENPPREHIRDISHTLLAKLQFIAGLYEVSGRSESVPIETGRLLRMSRRLSHFFSQGDIQRKLAHIGGIPFLDQNTFLLVRVFAPWVDSTNKKRPWYGLNARQMKAENVRTHVVKLNPKDIVETMGSVFRTRIREQRELRPLLRFFEHVMHKDGQFIFLHNPKDFDPMYLSVKSQVFQDDGPEYEMISFDLYKKVGSERGSDGGRRDLFIPLGSKDIVISNGMAYEVSLNNHSGYLRDYFIAAELNEHSKWRLSNNQGLVRNVHPSEAIFQEAELYRPFLTALAAFIASRSGVELMAVPVESKDSDAWADFGVYVDSTASHFPTNSDVVNLDLKELLHDPELMVEVEKYVIPQQRAQRT